MCRNAIPAVIELEHFGVPFSRTDEGRIYQRPFGGHTLNHGKAMAKRACAAADRTGHAILHTLYQQALRNHAEFFVERSEEHTSELQSLMRISYAVFCLKKNTPTNNKVHR